MESSFLNLLLVSGIQLLYLVGIFIAMGFIIGYIEKYSNAYLVKSFGRKGILLTAWIGTPIHELGHAFMCLVFRHKIIKIKLLQLNDPNGVLGYVEHAYNPKSIYQRMGKFFIGLAPLFSGIVALMLSLYFLLPDTYEAFSSFFQEDTKAGQVNWESMQSVFGACVVLWKSLFSFSNLLNPAFWLFLLLAISISSHMALSLADIKQSTEGFFMMFALIFVFNMISGLLGFNSQEFVLKLTTYNSYLLGLSSIAIFFSLFTLGISFILYKLAIRS